jgi:hypothetical protein
MQGVATVVVVVAPIEAHARRQQHAIGENAVRWVRCWCDRQVQRAVECGVRCPTSRLSYTQTTPSRARACSRSSCSQCDHAQRLKRKGGDHVHMRARSHAGSPAWQTVRENVGTRGCEHSCQVGRMGSAGVCHASGWLTLEPTSERS